MIRQSIPLGRILGISIGLDYSWFIILALLTWSLAATYYPVEFPNWPPSLYWIAGAITAVMLFVSVLLHELGHAVAAMQYRIPVRRITLFIFGGVAEIASDPPRPTGEFLIAIAGPLVSLFLAVLCYLLEPLLRPIPPLFGLFKYLAYINAALVVFNLIPGFPLDGGRVLRAIVWAVAGSFRRATLVASNVGRAFGFLFIGVGLWQMYSGNLGGGLWLAFIGWFLDSAAAAQVQQIGFQDMLAGHTVAEVMNRNCPVISGALSLQTLVDEQMFSLGRRCFVVSAGEQIVGLLTLHQMKEVPRTAWTTTTVGEVMLPMKDIRHVRPDMELWKAIQAMDREGVNQLPVIVDGKLAGMLSREDVITHLRNLQELGVLLAH